MKDRPLFSFERALQWAKCGRPIRRACWLRDRWVELEADTNGQERLALKTAVAGMHLWTPPDNDLLATDWELLEPYEVTDNGREYENLHRSETD